MTEPDRRWLLVEGAPSALAEVLGLRLVHQLAGGEFGAYAAMTADRTRVVLKRVPPDPKLNVDRVTTACRLAEPTTNHVPSRPRRSDCSKQVIRGSCAGRTR